MAEKVEELLAQAGALLPRRPSPAEAFEAQAKGRCSSTSAGMISAAPAG